MHSVALRTSKLSSLFFGGSLNFKLWQLRLQGRGEFKLCGSWTARG